MFANIYNKAISKSVKMAIGLVTKTYTPNEKFEKWKKLKLLKLLDFIESSACRFVNFISRNKTMMPLA